MEKLGQYEILEKIGAGSMGVVYKARHHLLEKVVAIKTMAASRGADEQAKTRFFREARAVAQLSHKNIITVYDMGIDNGEVYLAMEFLDGEDLKTKISRHEPAPLEERLKICLQVCEGLGHAHRKGVIHRDIKPGNIFLTESGDIKILDFGLARLAASDLTGTQDKMGTPAYMSPEQLGSDKVDTRSDIYSAGVVFYELITFKRAFDAESLAALFFQIVHGDPNPINTADPLIPDELGPILMKAIAKSPDKRYQTMEEMRDDLEDFMRFLEGRKRALLSEARDVLGRLNKLIQENQGLLADAAEKLAQMKTALPALFPKTGEGGGEEATLSRNATQYGYLEIAGICARTEREIERLSTQLEMRKRASPLMEQAAGFERKGEFQEALRIAEEVLRDDPSNFSAHSLQKKLLAHLREQKLKEQIDEEIRRLLKEAETRFSHGAFAQCLAVLDDALKLQPGHAGATDLQELAQRSLTIEADLKEKQDRAKAAMTKAREALAAEAFAEAAQAAREAFENLPNEPEVRLLLEEIARTEEAFKARLERKKRIASLLADARSRVEAGDEDGALQQLEMLSQLDPDNSAAAQLRKQIERERSTRAAVARLFQEAGLKLASGDATACITLLSEAVKLQPGRRDVMDLMQRAQQIIEERAQREEKLRRVEAVLAAFEKALTSENPEEARRQLDRARTLVQNITDASGILAQIERAEVQYDTLVERIRKIEDLAVRARTQLAAGALEEAQAILADLESFAPGRHQTLELNAAIKQLLRDRERAEKERSERIAVYFGSAQRAEKSGDLERAGKLLDTLLAEEPHHPEARALRTRIEVQIAELQRAAQIKQERVQALLDQALRAKEKRRFERALQALDEALSLGEVNSEVFELRRTTAVELENERARESQRTEGERQRELGSKRLEARQYRPALTALNRARELLGTDPVLFSAIAEAEEGIRTEEKIARVKDLLARARQALTLDEFKQASTYASEVLLLDAQNEEVRELLERIEHLQDVKRKRTDIAALLARGRQELVREEFQAAAKSATEVLLLDDQNNEARDLLAKIDQAQNLKHQRTSHASLLARGGQALKQFQFEEAATVVRELLLLDPQNAEAKDLLKKIETAQDQKSRKDQTASLLLRAHKFLQEKEFFASTQTVKEILTLEPANKEARSLLKDIEREQKADEKERSKKARLLQAEQSIQQRSMGVMTGNEQAVVFRPTGLRGALLANRSLRYLLGATALLAIIAFSWSLIHTFRQDSYARDARDLFDQGEYDRALATLDRWLKADPQNQDARNLNEEIQRASKLRTVFVSALKELDYSQASSALSQLTALTPKDPNLAQYRKKLEDGFSAEFIDQFLGDLTLWDAPKSWRINKGRLAVADGMGLIRGRYYRNCQATFNLTFDTGDTASWIVHAADPKNYYRFQLTGPKGNPPNSLTGFKSINGRETTILSPTAVGKDLGIKGDQLEITIRMEGDKIRHFIQSGERPEEGDPKEMASVTDGTIPAGTLGFLSKGGETFFIRALGIVSHPNH